DRIQITYLPEEGVTVFVNGERKGAVEGEDFARAFFSIWLGDHPVDKKMKLVLLGYHENDFL
ncbi:MAG: chalcone isomerase family protein, partial [Candidatus Omnitrophica bacterium]|nr:chalcone isomerase family protein [Candidatus Omnitrophota bacterium]